MSKKKDDQAKQRSQYERRRIAKNVETGEVIRQDGPGYDVPMIRDFIEHLLLELRVQQWEMMQIVNQMNATGERGKDAPYSDNLGEQLQPYLKKYNSALIAATGFDTRNATEEEIKACSEAWLRVKGEKREEQIGHLEALQELFDEAFHCAKMPFGRMADGTPIQPVHEVNIREWSDRIQRDDS